MAIAAALVVVPLGLLFLLSGLIVNVIQTACFITIRPFSKSMYRKINRVIAELLWLELVWLFDWWAGVQVKFYADSETYKSMGKEHALIISNHRSDLDWLVGWVLAQGNIVYEELAQGITLESHASVELEASKREDVGR